MSPVAEGCDQDKLFEIWEASMDSCLDAVQAASVVAAMVEEAEALNTYEEELLRLCVAKRRRPPVPVFAKDDMLPTVYPKLATEKTRLGPREEVAPTSSASPASLSAASSSSGRSTASQKELTREQLARITQNREKALRRKRARLMAMEATSVGEQP